VTLIGLESLERGGLKRFLKDSENDLTLLVTGCCRFFSSCITIDAVNVFESIMQLN
jgi:hypothetical protein